jgi:hypothetical protein
MDLYALGIIPVTTLSALPPSTFLRFIGILSIVAYYRVEQGWSQIPGSKASPSVTTMSLRDLGWGLVG